MNKKVTPGEIVILAAGVVALVFSFFDFYSNVIGGVSSWGSGLFPVATFIALFVVVMALQLALEKFANVDIPNIPGFTWTQVRLAFGFFATLLAVGFLIQTNPGLGIGYWLELVSAIAALTGAILLSRERASA